MEEKEKWEIRDPKLPQINGGTPGNVMENRRLGAPLPRDLSGAAAQQNLSM